MTYIQRLNDEEMIDLDDLGIRTRDFIVHSPSYNHELEEIPDIDGAIDLGTTVGTRTITCLFRFITDNWIDFGEKRDEVFDLFESKEPFYLIEKRNLFKRWLVKVVDTYEIPQRNVFGNFEINFFAIKGYAESIGTTLQSSTFQHLDVPVTVNDYRNIRATRFRIYNPGKPIDPRSINDHLKITMVGQSNNLQIKNLTTGDVWQYNGTTSSNQTVVLEGIRSTKNGLSIFRDTNKKLISLARGWNVFEVTGTPNGKRRAVQAYMPRRAMPSSEKPNPFTFEFIFKF